MSKRIGILLGGIALVFCLLVARLFKLQVGSLHAAKPADEDEARTVVLPAARGAILDRDGKLLRASREAFDVYVTGPAFREKNLVDALADLCVLLGGIAPESGPVERARLVAELGGASPRPAIERILAMDVSAALADEADDLHGRARILIEPDGTLVRPATFARRRIQDALLVVAGDGGRTPRAIRAKMRESGATVAVTAGADAGGVEARIAGEQSLLARVGGELGIGDAGEVRAAIDQICDRHFRRVEVEIEKRVDDAICLQEFGSWDLDDKRMDEDEKAELREQAGVGPKALWSEVRPALCGAVRASPGFERSRYMDARKEGQTRMELAQFRHDELGFGGTFAVAGLVDGPGGLRALGFELAASFARDRERAHPGGVLALVLGEVNRRNRAVDGLEGFLDRDLKGKPGKVVVGDQGPVVVEAAQHGKDVKLTLSLTLQERVQAVLDRMGAAAVVDVRTGGILAAATWPPPTDRDTSSAIAELAELDTKRRELRSRLRAGEDGAEPLLASVHDRILRHPGFHRALTFQSNIPPGSVMKTVTLLAGLEAGVITPSFEIDCQTPDAGVHGTGHFGCHRHGRTDLESAIERSCNEYCYQTVKLLGGSTPLFGLYEKLGLFDEVTGAIGKESGGYLRRAIRNDDPKNLAIGQGSLSIPAVKLAAMAASLATGRAVRAHFYAPDGLPVDGEPFAQEANLAVIRSGMRRVAAGARGTAAEKCRQLDPLGIAGKTGTAQLKTGVEHSDQIYSAWFVGFAPYENPRYAFAVLIDRTHDANGADAAPVAARVIDACYSVLGGRP